MKRNMIPSPKQAKVCSRVTVIVKGKNNAMMGKTKLFVRSRKLLS